MEDRHINLFINLHTVSGVSSIPFDMLRSPGGAYWKETINVRWTLREKQNVWVGGTEARQAHFLPKKYSLIFKSNILFSKSMLRFTKTQFQPLF